MRGWTDVAGSLFRLGATSYGGPAIMGIMQAEPQEGGSGNRESASSKASRGFLSS
jgi:hypothetical protein